MTAKGPNAFRVRAHGRKILAELLQEATLHKRQVDDDGPLAIPEGSPLDSAQSRRAAALEVA